MTVRELIELLEKFPPDSAVLVNVPERPELVELEPVIFSAPDYIELRIKGDADPAIVAELERQAVARCREAGVNAREEMVLSFVRSCSPRSILSTSLEDILAVANAF